MPHNDISEPVPSADILDAVVVRRVGRTKKNAVVWLVQGATGLTLEASALVIETHEAIKCTDEADAKALKNRLEQAGASVTLESSGVVVVGGEARPVGVPDDPETTKPVVFSSLGMSPAWARSPERDVTPGNPVGAGLVLLGAVLVLIGSFTPVHTFGTLPIYQNSFVQDGDWWILVVALAMGITAVYFLIGATEGRVWRVIVPSVIAVGAGIYGQTTKFQTLQLNSDGQQLFNASSVKASAGIGVYLVMAGGILGLVGAGLLSGRWRPVGVPEYRRRTKACPDCAEKILADARVCKHCGYRFDAVPDATS